MLSKPHLRGRMRPTHLAVSALLLLGCAFVNVSQAQGQVSSKENTVFSATVTNVETDLGGNGWHYLTETVHIHNVTRQPLTLGVELAKVSSTDDRGNPYAALEIRGIGQVAGTRVDPKFVLPPDGGGDILIQQRWRGAAVFGTIFDLKLPLRVITPLEAGQYKLGAEHIVTFEGLKAGHVATPPGARNLSANTVNAGPFTMQVTKLTPSKTARAQTVIVAAKIQNTSNKPIVLAYEGTTSFGIDDQGNRFYYGTAGTHDTSFSGIGLATGQKADPQFTLAPGEARDVQFTVFRRLGREVAGTKLTYYVALSQLEVLPADQIRTVRQFSLTFPRMAGLN